MSSDTATWAFTYDANGMRTSRSNGTTTWNYVYNGGQLTQMNVAYHMLYFTYGMNGPTTVTWNGVTYYYALNVQGDVIGIFDSAGNCVVTYNWDNAWGYNPVPEGPMAATLGSINPLRYRGYVYDEETGLYYLQSRYYNPTWGRFINADNVYDLDGGLQGYNIFLYCANNPINRIDSTGADSNKVDDADITADDELSERGGGGDGFSGGNHWNTFTDTLKAALNGLNLATGAKDTLLSEPKSPEMIGDNYIRSNKIDAHKFKQNAGKVPQGKLSKYNIYKDKANHNRLWVGSNNTKNRDWRETIYFFDDLVTQWRK